MNILYISKLSGKASSGPTYSVPKQIEAQSCYDNVFWYNVSKANMADYRKYKFYHDIEEYPNQTLADLPVPFNSPDLIIIEEVYVYHNPKILYEIYKSGIPYILIPRSQLTRQAQNKKKFKKILGNFLIYGRIIRNAHSIQYLTSLEKTDSSQWKTKGIILPNGIDANAKTKRQFRGDSIHAIFIGRIEPYQKGLDLLIDAVIPIKEELIKVKFSLKIIGSVKDTAPVSELCNKINKYGLSDIIQVVSNPLFGDEKIIELLDSDVFVMTSRFEGLSMGLLEALSLGLPCLVTQGTNMKKEIEENDAGWTAENTVESIRNAILRMINERENLLEKGINALDLSRQYNWNVIAERAHIYYKSIKQMS